MGLCPPSTSDSICTLTANKLAHASCCSHWQKSGQVTIWLATFPTSLSCMKLIWQKEGVCDRVSREMRRPIWVAAFRGIIHSYYNNRRRRRHRRLGHEASVLRVFAPKNDGPLSTARVRFRRNSLQAGVWT